VNIFGVQCALCIACVVFDVLKMLFASGRGQLKCDGTQTQKPDIVFRRNGQVHLNRPVGASVLSTTGSQYVLISGINAGYTMFRGSVKGTSYPLHYTSLPFTSPPVRHRVPSHFNWSLRTYDPTIYIIQISESSQ
jgi:hypothetical protein